MLLQSTTFTSPFHSPITSTTITKHSLKSLNPSTHFLGTTLFPSLGRGLYLGTNRSKSSVVTRIHASFLEAPVLWAGRMCIFYALVKFGLAGSPPENPPASESETGVDDLGFSKWIEQIQGKPDDDQFRDATSHKGCQIRRESAHGESVCCNNVRALFDELPTPHVLVEITPFPAGPLTENDYAKAEKLERLLRPGPSI